MDNAPEVMGHPSAAHVVLLLGASAAVLMVHGCGRGDPPEPRRTPPAPGPPDPAAPVVDEDAPDPRPEEDPPEPEPAADPVPDYYDEFPEAGQRARGAYFSGPYVRRRGAAGILRTLRAAHLDAAVIDMKDGQGRVTYDSAIPILAGQERHLIADPAALVRDLRAGGIRSIARIVCFADPVLPREHPDRAILDRRPGLRGKPWVSWGTGGTWLDPYNDANHQLILALAREVAGFGFDELQLDYVRFPVDDGTEFAVYPADDGRERSQVLLSLLRRIDAEVSIPLGVDVFGLAAFDFGGTRDLGQDLETWTPYVEVFTPMLYLNSMRNWGRNLDNRALGLIRAGTGQLRRRLGPRPVIRPFLQAFPQGADTFDPAFIADQIRGARLGKADGFLFWHPRSNYAMLTRGMRGPARRLSPFPPGERAAARAGPSPAPLLP